MTGKITPLYVICSPFRRVGKTVIARLLTEFYLLDDRAVKAFDLADEGPQLMDYLPEIAIASEINETRGQMALFDRILTEGGSAKIIDVSHRAFNSFFKIAQEIKFFAEARRHHIEPLVLFIVDAEPKSSRAYAALRTSLVEASLLPARNKTEWQRSLQESSSADQNILMIDVPLLHFQIKLEIDQMDFSFAEFYQFPGKTLSEEMRNELLDWIRYVYYQFEQVECFLGSRQTNTRAFQSSFKCRMGMRREEQNAVPEEVSKFAPKKHRGGTRVPLDECGSTILTMLQDVGRELNGAKNRIDELEIEAQKLGGRAARGEAWLQVIEEEIKSKLIDPGRIRILRHPNG
jgi:hypothetical protein